MLALWGERKLEGDEMKVVKIEVFKTPSGAMFEKKKTP